MFRGTMFVTAFEQCLFTRVVIRIYMKFLKGESAKKVAHFLQ
jgi:hypothetical protein